MFNRISIFSVLLLSLVAATSANGAPIRWDFSDVNIRYDDGYTTSWEGTFIYDADDDRYFGINVRSAFARWDSDKYILWSRSSSLDLERFKRPGYHFYQHNLFLEFVAPLTNTGGDVIVTGFETLAFEVRNSGLDEYDILNAQIYGFIVGTPAVLTAVPLPAGFPLILAGLGVLAALRCRRQSNRI